MPEFEVRKLEPRDNPGVATVIRTVMPEFGASGEGFAIVDPEVDDMYGTYCVPRAVFFVIEREGRIVGGAGIAQLTGAKPTVCELRKMYFLSEARGKGLGQKLIDLCLAAARARDYQQCYLETLKTMTVARALYERNGFQRVDKPLGNTGHFGCDAWYVKAL